MPSSIRFSRAFWPYLPPHTQRKNLQLTFLAFSAIAPLFLLYPLPVCAGGSASKPAAEIVEDEIRRHVVGLTPVVEEEGAIQTKSQKPMRPKPQNATLIEASASPLRREYLGTKEAIFKKFADERVRCEQTDLWPHSAYGVVYMRFPGMSPDLHCWGTGALIAPHVVLTCAHNLYSHDYKERAAEVRFFPAINSKALPFSEAKVIEWYYPQTYEKTEKDDYGILILNRPLGEETGYFGLSILPPQKLSALRLSVTGYPADKVENKDRQYEMWGMEGPVHNIDPEYISYEVQTYRGQSGSPVCYKDGDEYRVVGIHVLPDPALSVNKATLLTKARYDQINTWIRESHRKRLKEVAVEGAKVIDLPKKDLEEAGMEALAQYNLPNLRCLYVWRNNIGDVGAEHLVRLQQLTDLNIESNNIGDAGVKYLAKLQNLTYLEIGGNNIGDAGAEHLSKLQNLTHLGVGGNKIGDAGVKYLARLQNLTYLGVGGNNIGDAGVKHLAKLQNLRRLYIMENDIGDVGAEHLAELQKLTDLSVLRTHIGAVGAGYLARLKRLGRLFIEGKNIGAAGIQALEAAGFDSDKYIRDNATQWKRRSHLVAAIEEAAPEAKVD